MGSRARGLQELHHVGSVVLAPRLWSTGSTVVAHRLSCPIPCRMFSDQGNLCLLHWQAGSLPLSYQGSSCVLILYLKTLLNSLVQTVLCFFFGGVFMVLYVLIVSCHLQIVSVLLLPFRLEFILKIFFLTHCWDYDF